MARVQSILTYTLPANAGDKNPPPAPIRCGCDNLLLILEDQSLIRTALQGILSVEIKSVAVSATPVGSIDGNTGQSSLVWKYDYTVEYLDTDLTDTAYRVRKCDIKYNCCYSCGQAYTDRQLEGYVKSVLGDNVNNLDPQIPVITEQPIAVTDSLSIDLTSSGSFGHTLRADAKISAIADNIVSIQADGLYVPQTEFTASNNCALGGVGLAYAIRRLTALGGNNFLIDGAPEHSEVAAFLDYVSGAPAQGVAPNTDYLSASVQRTITNPSTCRQLQVAVFSELLTEFETPGIPFKYDVAIQMQFNGGGFIDVQGQTGYVPNSNVAILNRGTHFLQKTVIFTIAPGATTVVDARLRWGPRGTAGIMQNFAVSLGFLGGTV